MFLYKQFNRGVYYYYKTSKLTVLYNCTFYSPHLSLFYCLSFSKCKFWHYERFFFRDYLMQDVGYYLRELREFLSI